MKTNYKTNKTITSVWLARKNYKQFKKYGLKLNTLVNRSIDLYNNNNLFRAMVHGCTATVVIDE